MPRFRAIASLLVLACADGGTPGVTRETLPNGRIVATYAAGLGAREDTIQAAIRIGQLDGPAEVTFGDIRGIETDDQGRVYILDIQAAEIRTFAPDGTYLATIARRGEGPGEISAANGLAFGPEGRLWVHDYRKRALLVLEQDGTEVARHPAIVPGWGWLWGAVIDTAGVVWQSWNHPVGRRTLDPEFTGVVEGENREFYKSFDPTTKTYDSLSLGMGSYRTYSAAYNGGFFALSIPYSGGKLSTIDTRRRVWLATAESYTLLRLGERGDTTLELRVTEPSVPVTPADIAAWREGNADVAEKVPDALDAIEKLIPPAKPFIASIHTDDQDRLWIGRPAAPGEAPRYDVFSPIAEYLGTVRLVPGTVRGYMPLVRGGRILILVAGEDGDQAVVIGQLPAFLRES